jgi:capsular polysaccharide biosynthesis protein
MVTPAREHGAALPISEYLAVLRRRWWLLAICTAAAFGAAVAALGLQSPVYRASTRIEATGRLDHAQLLATDRLLRQITARIRTTSLAEAVNNRLGLDGPADALLGTIHAQALSDTLQIQIDVDHGDAAEARRIAATVAEVVQERQAAQMASAPEHERVVLTIVDRPSAAQLVWPQSRPTLLAAGLLGLLVGAAFAIVWDAFDDTIKSPEDVQRLVGLSTVGVVPSPSKRGAPGLSDAWPRRGRH